VGNWNSRRFECIFEGAFAVSKIAIVLTGVSRGMRNATRVVNTDWNLSKNSIKEKLIQPFIDDGNDVKVYLTTYFSDQVQSIIDFYSPQKLLLLNYEQSHQRTTYIQSLAQLLPEDIDYVVATRFDISFNRAVNSYPIEWGKVNFTFRQVGEWWKDHQYVDDNLFIFPKKFLLPFINAINEFHVNPYMGRRNPDLHPIYRYLVPIVGEDNTHFMMEGLHASHDNEYFELTGNGEKYKTTEHEDGSVTLTYRMFDKSASHTISKNEIDNLMQQHNLTFNQIQDKLFAMLRSKVLL
jgi:hypothetical protein